MILLSKLTQGLLKIPPETDCTISGLTLDSRLVKPGYVFFAYPGSHLDGRAFIEDAIQNGAAIIVAEDSLAKKVTHPSVFYVENCREKVSEMAARFYDYPAKSLHIVGVTGTNGKTSCTHFIASALQEWGQSCGVIGTLGNGLYGELLPGLLTTPDAVSLQQLLAEFQQQRAAYVAMEVSSHSLEQGRVHAIPFQVGIFTNLTRDHLDYHGTMEAYGAAKRKLFDNPHLQQGVINVDDEFGQIIMNDFAKHKNLIAYSLHQPYRDYPSIYVKKMHLDTTGIQAEIVSPWGEGLLQSSLMGQFNVSNLLAVFGALCLLKFPFQRVLTALSHLKPVPGRMQTLGDAGTPLVVVDYSHTPDSLEQALQALRKHCRGQLVCLFGCGGDRDRGKRPLMAAIAEKWADRVMVTDDNPRTEDPAQIVADIMAGFLNKKSVIVQHDRSKAIHDVIHYSSIGDTILIAGKGAELYQQKGTVKIPFSDSLEAASALTHKKKSNEN